MIVSIFSLILFEQKGKAKARIIVIFTYHLIVEDEDFFMKKV